MRQPTRSKWWAAAPVLALLVAGACGDDSDDGEAPADADSRQDEAAPDGAATAPTIDEVLESGGPLNIAHAGGDAQWPHSTLYAYGEAVAVGADMLELDVRLSADGVVMVHHDTDVDRITDGQGAVADRTAAELHELDAAYWFTPGQWDGRGVPDADYPYRGVRTGDVEPPAGYGPDDFTIPTFREVAERFPDMPLDIEIKGAGDEGVATAEALADEIAELGRTDSVVVVSYEQELVDAFHAAAPEVEVSPGIDDMLAWYFEDGDLDRYRILQLPTDFGDIEVFTEENFARLRAEDHDIYVWVFMDVYDDDTAESYRHYLDLGVDGIIAARPGEFPD